MDQGDNVRSPEVLPLDNSDRRDADAGDAVGQDGEVADLAPDLVDAPADIPVIVDLPVELPDLPRDIPVEKPPTDLVNGQPCQNNAWCRSKFCVDGVCCNSACESQDPMRCTACSMVKTGQGNGICGPDRTRERMKCGEACGQVLMNVPAVLSMVCLQGTCRVPEVPTIVDTCRKQFDNCTTSFCNQATNRTARCVHTLCPQGGTCCCEAPANPAARSCVAVNACNNDRACVSQ